MQWLSRERLRPMKLRDSKRYTVNRKLIQTNNILISFHSYNYNLAFVILSVQQISQSMHGLCVRYVREASLGFPVSDKFEASVFRSYVSNELKVHLESSLLACSVFTPESFKTLPKGIDTRSSFHGCRHRFNHNHLTCSVYTLLVFSAIYN